MSSTAQILTFMTKPQIEDQRANWKNVRLSTFTIMEWPNSCGKLTLKPVAKGKSGKVLEYYPTAGNRIHVPEDDYNVTISVVNPTISASFYEIYYGDHQNESWLFSGRNHMAYTCRPAITPTPGNPFLFPYNIRTRIDKPMLRASVLSVGAQVTFQLFAIDEEGALTSPSIPFSSRESVTANYQGTIEFTTASPLNPGDRVGLVMGHVLGVPVVDFVEIV